MKVYTRKKENKSSAKDIFLAKYFTKYGDQVEDKVDFKITSNGLDSSDHLHFWNNDISAIFFSQNWETDFNTTGDHNPNDFVETLNFDTLYGSYRYIAGSVLAWAFDFK